jgi:hypothetical protein
MNTNLSRLLRAGVLAGGLMAVSAGVAHAAETTGGHSAPGLLAGNQVVVPIQIPITIGGNAVSVLAHSVHAASGASSTSSGASSTTPGHPTSPHHGRHSVGSGNQVAVPVTAPVTAGGNAVSVLGRSRHGGTSGTTAGSTSPSGTTPGLTPTSSTGLSGPSGLGGLLAGNQVLVPICAPIDASGNAVAVLSGASAAGDPAGCAGSPSPSTAPAAGPAAGRHGGTASGNQVAAPVQAPVNVGGNAVSVLGRSTATDPGPSGTSGSSNGTTGTTGSTGSTGTTEPSGVGSGNQVLVPVCIPVDASGNAIGGGTASGSTAGCGTSAPATSVTSDPPTGTPITGPTTPTPGTPGGSSGGTSTGTTSTVGDGSNVLGLHLAADQSAGSASSASLAMTGGAATPLLGIGSLLALTGLLLRFAGRERIRAER